MDKYAGPKEEGKIAGTQVNEEDDEEDDDDLDDIDFDDEDLDDEDENDSDDDVDEDDDDDDNHDDDDDDDDTGEANKVGNSKAVLSKGDSQPKPPNRNLSVAQCFFK